MEIVSAFKSKDGVLHNSKRAALDADFRVDIQGFFNRTGGNITATGSYVPAQIASRMTGNLDDITELLLKYRRAVRVEEKKEEAQKNENG